MAEQDRNYHNGTSYYAPDKPPVNKKRPKARTRKLLAAGLVLILIIGSGKFVLAKHPVAKNKVTKAIASIISSPTPKTSPEGSDIDTMGQTINSVINNNPDIDISVNLINLDNDQSQHYGVNQTFQAASTAKILTAEDFLHQVELGNQSLSESVNDQTAQYELQQMIVVSDDDAWEDLNELLGYNNLQNYADQTFNISDYQAYNNSLSSGDIALALQYLWEGKVLNSTNSQLLLSYLKQANYREYIVPAVPSEDTIYHKIGLYEDYVNDAAIITNGPHAFVIVIFTNGNGAYNWPARATMMQQITRAALKAYFNQS